MTDGPSSNLLSGEIFNDFQIDFLAVICLKFSNVTDHFLIFMITHKATIKLVLGLLTVRTLGRIVFAPPLIVFSTFKIHLMHEALDSLVIRSCFTD